MNSGLIPKYQPLSFCSFLVDLKGLKSQRKLLKDIKVVPSEDCTAQHKPVICNLKIKKVKSTMTRFVSRTKVWKLNTSSVKK